jgi:hypothetical protein
MLLIWDIHATRKRVDACIDSIQLLVERYPDDDTLVFVGDYVYHFSYDMVALHALFTYWVELVKKWKKLIILAWNHDWIQNQFVFEQAKVAFDLFQSEVQDWSLQYITQPTYIDIQWQDCLLFPFTAKFDTEEVRSEYAELSDSSHTKERLSWTANSILHTMIDTWKSEHLEHTSKKLLLIHHRYIAGKAFPWQFARFSYQSPALSNHRLDDDRLMIVSWHLHQPFVEKNYCCIWSIWSTSPLEINQQKYLFQFDPETKKCNAHPSSLNPYLQFTSEEVAVKSIQQLCEEVDQRSRKHLLWWNLVVEVHERLWDISLSDTTLTLITDAHDGLQSVPDSIKQAVGTVRIKQSKETLETLISTMQDSSLLLDESFADWKTLLWEFLKAKFGDKAEQYQKDLEKLEVI